MGTGFLKIKVFVGDNLLPVKDVKVLVKDTRGNTIYDLTTDENGLTEKVPLDAPSKEHSIKPDSTMPYFSVCDVEVPFSQGYRKVIVHDVQIFDGETSILPLQLNPAIIGDTPKQNTEEFFIPFEHGVDETRIPPEHMSFDNYGNDNINITQVPQANEVQIPQYITVHLGSPNDVSARNIKVLFADYIKNVASSEIFPTWEESAIIANIYCQISFALNRIYTVWYRSRGNDFDITNSTAFDQAFVEGRNIFENISRIVDNIFNMFIRRQGRREPFFASYCNGTTSQCAGLSQWGSQELALRGYTPIEILRYYFPNDVQIVESTNFTTNTQTFPGTSLREGSTGPAVMTMQEYLNRISGNFFITPAGRPDGIFGVATKNSTMDFQRINDLAADGIIGRSTWYAITRVYVGVTELAELTSEGERIGIGTTPPTVVIQSGSRGEYVVELQFLLNYIALFFPAVPFVIQNGVFRDDTKRGVTEFQKEFGLTPDGIVGPATWRRLYDVYHSIIGTVPVPPPSAEVPQFPGTSLRIGSTGDNVLLMQRYLNSIARVFPAIPTLVADGIFGSATQASVIAFQRLFGLTVDGIIGRNTWNEIVSVYNSLPSASVPEYPGISLRVGSSGSNVSIMQSYLNTIARRHTSIPTLTVDGAFGPATERAVIAFQRLFGLVADGIIGRTTWNYIVSHYNLINTGMASISSASIAEAQSHTFDKYAPLLTLMLLRRF